MLTHKRLKEVLHYNPKTGKWTWLINRRGKAKAGNEAGHISYGHPERPRRIISVDRVRYPASRLAYFYRLGRWPKNLIDHKNLDTLNDRWSNLRLATYSQNGANSFHKNDLGFKGVRKRGRKYHAVLTTQGRQIHIGVFDTPELANKAYKQLAITLFGEFAR